MQLQMLWMVTHFWTWNIVEHKLKLLYSLDVAMGHWYCICAWAQWLKSCHQWFLWFSFPSCSFVVQWRGAREETFSCLLCSSYFSSFQHNCSGRCWGELIWTSSCAVTFLNLHTTVRFFKIVIWFFYMKAVI